ncbi:MAG TPA: DNA alkylation repair protein [Saprospirales bacterium]|nr:DNA alkylation repair protein [Saprospirales bacterium]
MAELKAIYPAFKGDLFLSQLFDPQWEGLELKQRIRRISEVLRLYLPDAYPKALELVVRTTDRYLQRHGEKLTFEYAFLPDFVEAHGVSDPDVSIPALETITRWSSAEFAVRPFLLQYPERMYRQMLQWSEHPSPMVRRLSSEGIRPRLPWGMGVPALKRDPSPIFPILENLKNDPAETVRRSVANNLNDIAKDHPEQVLAIAERWLGNNPQTDWIVRHACRGLLKKGNAAALAHFGFEKGIAGIQVDKLRCTPSVPVGGRLDFSFFLQNQSEAAVPVRLEYGIDYQTLSGKTSVKVFKIKELVMAPGLALTVEKYQRFQDFTTRKHFAGIHKLTILVNGASMAQCSFEVSG